MLKKLTLAGIILSVAACSTTPQLTAIPPTSPSPGPTIVMQPKPAPTSEIPSVETNIAIVPVSPTTLKNTQNDAVIALLDSGEQDQQQGHYQSAQNTLQRAQRIAPRDPDVYYQLAETHRDLQDYHLAEQVALKGVSIVQGQTDQLRRFWLLITEIHTLAGDDDAADQAQQKADQY